METKPFELSVLISLVNGYDVLNVTPEEQLEVVSHIHGKPVEPSAATEMFETAIAYIKDNYPMVARAAELVQYLPPDHGRYNKLIDMFKKWFHISPMVLQPA